MGKSRKALRRPESRPRKAGKGAELAKRAIDAVANIERKLIGFVQGFQQNLNQLYMNQKAISDMAYTNNVHVTVLREVLFEKEIMTKEEYGERIEKELAARDAIQKKQLEEAKQQAEELKKKQAEEAAAQIAEAQPASSEQEEQVEPKVFGGDLGVEETNGEAEQAEQGHLEDHVPSLSE